MPITRDPDFPENAAQLMQAFNRCADGHGVQTVIEASANMLSAGLHTYARMKNMTEAEAMEFANDALRRTISNFQDNWERAGKSKPGDITVQTN